MKILTIYTDASRIHTKGVSAVAYYLVCDAGKSLHTKLCPKDIQCITTAEMFGAAQALYTASRLYGLETFEKIIINLDSTGAIKHLKETNHKPRFEVHRRLHLAFKKTRGKAKVEVRHVKGHQKGDNIRGWVNNLVDKACRKAAREAVKQMEKEQVTA